MFLPAERQFADWLSGTVTDYTSTARGVNACIALLSSTSSLDGSDLVPPNVVVQCQSVNPVAARKQVDAAALAGTPVVTVSIAPGSDLETCILQPTAGPLIGRVQLHIGVEIENSDSDEGIEDVYYILRAILKSWQYFTRPENDAKRTRADCTLVPYGDERIGFLGVGANRDDKRVGGGLTIPVEIRITTP